MARYKEKTLSLAGGAFLLLASFIWFYAPWQLGLRELSDQEGFWAVLAQELWLDGWPLSRAHGVGVPDAGVLYPLLTSFFMWLGVPVVVALRGISLICLAIMTGVVGSIGVHTAGRRAGMLAMAMVIGTNLMLEKAGDGSPVILLALLVLSGQLLWFQYGFRMQDWNKAWVAVWIFAGLAFGVNFIYGVVLTLGPLLFMRRPLTIWNKILRPGFFIGLGCFLLMVFLWLLPWLVWAPATVSWKVTMMHNFWENLFFFPFDMAFRLLPWVVVAWAPFCVGIQWLTPVPIFSRFLRTVVITTFFILWLLPNDEVRYQLLLVGGLAILSGFDYDLVVRRYGNFMIWVCRLLTPAAWAVGLFILAIYIFPVSFLETLSVKSFNLQFRENPVLWWRGVITAVIIIALMTVVFSIRKRLPVWLYFLLLTWAPMGFINAVNLPYRAQVQERKAFGVLVMETLNNADVAKDEVIYTKMDIRDLYKESCYDSHRWLQLQSLSELPEEGDVYLLSTGFPQYPKREWKNLLPQTTTYRGHRIFLFRGVPAPRTEDILPW